MRLKSLIALVITFALAAAACLGAASLLVTAVQDNSEIAVRAALDGAGHDWAEVEADGLRVVLSGTAPSEAQRFNAISTVGGVVDTARIIDTMAVTASRAPEAPRFSAEILRNASGISIIGLVPASSDREGLVERLAGIAGAENVTDLLETADHPVPDGWREAMRFTAETLADLPRSKISVEAGRVSVTAITDSEAEKAALERRLRSAAPRGVTLALDITAPRPVITPFTLRYGLDQRGGRFDACSADTEDSRARILKAAAAAGGDGGAACTIGLGVPSPAWAEAVTLGIAALDAVGAGTITFADADVTLVAAEGTDPAAFDRAVGELEAALPDVFVLHAVLPVPEGTGEAAPAEFTATLSPEGQVQLRGRLNDENLQRMADAYAKARFGSASVYSAARTAEGLPADWPVRVLAAIETLSRLQNGAVTVSPDGMTVTGTAAREDAGTTIAGFLSERLGEGQTWDLDIAYRAPPPPEDEPLTPEVCESRIAEAQRSSGKLTFEPGSATIAAGSLETMNAIADILTDCGDLRIEIQGHTDSQGRESMNEALSQDRADAVLNELRARRILTGNFTAKGYGESTPIADNKTEDGREANRRIEFRLISDGPDPQTETTLDAVAGETPLPEEESADR